VAIDYVTECARAAGFDNQALYQIQLAVDEACANVVQHAYEGMEPGNMEVSCRLDEQCLVIQVREWGRGFDPDSVAEPDVHAPLEERAFGGLGLFLLKQMVDGVTFRFDPERGNELTMVKRLQVGG
jgi:serine/threonine-protein kinase RsbW